MDGKRAGFYSFLLMTTAIIVTGCSPYSAETQKQMHECQSQLSEGYHLYKLGAHNNLEGRPFMEQAANALADAKVDQALQNYDDCVVKAKEGVRALQGQSGASS